MIQQPTDAIIRVTSTAICGSDLHLYEVLGPYLKPGDVLGHEAMGIVEEVGTEVSHIAAGDRVVIPFNISCGRCWMCERGLFAQRETTQVRAQGKGAQLFGYTSRYGSVPGGQAEFLRVPQAQFGPIKVPVGPADEQFLYLSDILPTAWQAVARADRPGDRPRAVLGDRRRRHGGSRQRRCRPGAEDDRTASRCDRSEGVTGTQRLATHRLPLAEAAGAYEMFQKKKDGCVKVVLKPSRRVSGRAAGRRRRTGPARDARPERVRRADAGWRSPAAVSR